MANVNNPHGLRPLMRTMAGGNPGMEPYTKAAAYAFAIYKWDPVTVLAGVLNGPASGITPGTTRYQGVNIGAFSLASLLATMLIMDSPDAIFEAQEDNTGGSNIAAAKMGYNANLTTTAGASVTRDNSAVQISGTSVNTTGTLDVKLLRLLTDPTNAYGAFGRCELIFNKHLMNKEITET